MSVDTLIKKKFLPFLILGCILRWIGIDNGYWYDEWSSFYYSNPNLTIKQIFNAVISEEGAQPLYFIIASKWNYLFSYSPEKLRYLSFFLGSVSIILFVILLKEFSKNSNFIYLATFLFSSNYFLIQFSQESRYYSLSVFFSILNLIFFFRFLKKNKYVYYYIFFSILSLLTNIFAILLIFSQFFFLIIKKKKIQSISAIISFFFWYLLDFKYISSIFEKSYSFNISDTINFNFLVGYYFNIYFGNIFLGGLILFFIFINLINLKKFNSNILFCILCIFVTYVVPIIYSLLKNPVLRPRYIIFIVPIIIIYFSYLTFRIEKKILRNIFLSSVILLSVINNFQFKPIIPKPDTKAAIKLIANSNNSFLFINADSSLINNYFVNLSLAKKKNIIFLNKNQILDKNFFWSICLNNPRFATNNKTDDPSCLFNPFYVSHKIFEIKKVSDYILVLYQKYH